MKSFFLSAVVFICVFFAVLFAITFVHMLIGSVPPLLASALNISGIYLVYYLTRKFRASLLKKADA